jgi:hypothetical protein
MKFAPSLALLLVAIAGCAGPDLNRSSERGPSTVHATPVSSIDGGIVMGDGGGFDGGGTDAPIAASVSFDAPTDGSTFVRDRIVGAEWVATVTLEASASGVASVEFFADETFSLGTDDTAPYSVDYDFHGDGVRMLAVVGRDASGAEVARDTVSITINPPADTGCHAMLDALGLDWAPAGANRGIADPVRVQPVIDGVRFRYVSTAEPTAMLMDCELAPRLVELAHLVAPFGIDEVIHIGIYNYRCIGGGDPDVDDCTPSQHARARAIDLHAFGLAGSDVEYSTEDDFVITSSSSCPLVSSSEPDRVLKEIACSLYSERIFQIVLTPNYNAAHRNHYHVDMTEGSMFIGQGVEGVDPEVGIFGD